MNKAFPLSIKAARSNLVREINPINLEDMKPQQIFNESLNLVEEILLQVDIVDEGELLDQFQDALKDLMREAREIKERSTKQSLPDEKKLNVLVQAATCLIYKAFKLGPLYCK